jgi:hypothetical protein
MRLAAVLRSVPERAATLSGESARDSQRRRAERRSLDLSAITNSPVAGDTQVLIRDISAQGLLIEAEPTALSIDDRIEVTLPSNGAVRCRVAWTSDRFFGCEFSEPISAAAMSAALLKSRPAATKQILDVTESDGDLPEKRRSRLQPELNFSAALILSLALWGLIGGAVFLIWVIYV